MLELRLSGHLHTSVKTPPLPSAVGLPGNDFDTVNAVVSNNVSVHRRQLARRSRACNAVGGTNAQDCGYSPDGRGMDRREWTCLRISDRRAWRVKRLKTDAIRIVREIRRDMGEELPKRIAVCERAQFVRDTKTPY